MHFFFEYPDSSSEARASPEPTTTQPTTKPPESTPTAAPLASRHPPFVNRQCQNCHVRAMGQSPRANFVSTCRKCHPAYFEYHRFGHAPTVSGACLFCHLMHVSHQKTLLKAPQAVLCTSCHPAQQNEEALKSYHRNISGVACTACHEPHFATSQALLKPEDVRRHVMEEP